MNMSSRLRKFTLTAHITVSVGWLGAVLAYLSLAVVIKTSEDISLVRAAYLALEPITSYVLVPLAIASLITGIVISLGTSWGLFRHYWVIFKLILTVFSIIILLAFTQSLTRMVSIAADSTTSINELREMGAGISHAVGALVILLIIMILSVYKPKGMTRYGWQKQQKSRKGSSQ
ncbi:DUF2269 domain-containing protein [Robertmurraya sp. FSL R5-0851]|uniref:DUF2269 domain-containing protein n=1 Tax=Robertmurraya sp. FSL R5-0851 TaxID=2921584 RepID=UPI0030F6582C